MTFLSKLGKFLAKAGAIAANIAGIAAGIGPIIQPFLGAKGGAIEGKVVNDLTQIAGVVTTAEAILQQPGSGAAKLAAATPLVMSILQTSEAISGKKVANEALFQQGASKITSGMADVLNSLHPDSVPNTPGV